MRIEKESLWKRWAWLMYRVACWWWHQWQLWC